MKKIKMPPCVIMAGGLGKRLGAITKNVPKPVIKINGKPFLYYLLQNLQRQKFEKFQFLLSYKNLKIKNFLEKYSKQNPIRYKIFIDKQKKQGTYKSLISIYKSLNSVFFYTNADEIPNFDINKAYRQFKKKNSILFAILKSNNGNLIKKNNFLKYSDFPNKKNYKECGFKFIRKKFLRYKSYKNHKIEEYLFNNKNIMNKSCFIILKKPPYCIDNPKQIKRTKNFLIR